MTISICKYLHRSTIKRLSAVRGGNNNYEFRIEY